LYDVILQVANLIAPSPSCLNMASRYALNVTPRPRTTRRLVRGLSAVLAAVVLLSPAIALPDGSPFPPCEAGAPSPYPPFGDPPNVRTWRARDLPPGWTPPGCIRWAAQHFTLLTALSGRFHFEGEADDLLARFGSISAWRGIQYWSVNDGRFLTFITDSAAVVASDRAQRRADFAIEEMAPGVDLYFVQKDNRSSGEVTYRMRVEENARDHFVITIENVSTIWFVVLPVFGPGDVKATYAVERLGPGDWGYYSLSGVKEGGSALTGNEASYINRANALYHHVAGLPNDHTTRRVP
jgi:hypothetical protein